MNVDVVALLGGWDNIGVFFAFMVLVVKASKIDDRRHRARK